MTPGHWIAITVTSVWLLLMLGGLILEWRNLSQYHKGWREGNGQGYREAYREVVELCQRRREELKPSLHAGTEVQMSFTCGEHLAYGDVICEAWKNLPDDESANETESTKESPQ